MLKALVIDDSSTSRAIVAKLLGADCSLVAAASGEEGLKLLDQGGIDVLLLDLLMPGMDGKAVLAAMGEKGIEVPVVVMTADIQEATRKSLAAIGVGSLVNKPLTRERLLAGISEALGVLGPLGQRATP